MLKIRCGTTVVDGPPFCNAHEDGRVNNWNIIFRIGCGECVVCRIHQLSSFSLVKQFESCGHDTLIVCLLCKWRLWWWWRGLKTLLIHGFYWIVLDVTIRRPLRSLHFEILFCRIHCESISIKRAAMESLPYNTRAPRATTRKNDSQKRTNAWNATRALPLRALQFTLLPVIGEIFRISRQPRHKKKHSAQFYMCSVSCWKLRGLKTSFAFGVVHILWSNVVHGGRTTTHRITHTFRCTAGRGIFRLACVRIFHSICTIGVPLDTCLFVCGSFFCVCVGFVSRWG